MRGEERTPDGSQEFNDFAESWSGWDVSLQALNVQRKMEDVVLFLFTSGTTLLFKGVMHT